MLRESDYHRCPLCGDPSYEECNQCQGCEECCDCETIGNEEEDESYSGQF